MWMRILGLSLVLGASSANEPTSAPIACPDVAADVVGVINDARGRGGLPAVPWAPRLADIAREHLPYAMCLPGWCALVRTGTAHAWPDCSSPVCIASQARARVGYPGYAFEVLCGDTESARCGQKLLKGAHGDLVFERGPWVGYDWRAVGAACLRKANGVLTVSVFFGQHVDRRSSGLFVEPVFISGFE